MRYIITASDGKQIETTKAQAHRALFDYILNNLPKDREIIRNANQKIRELKAQIAQIKKDTKDKTGYEFPGF